MVVRKAALTYWSPTPESRSSSGGIVQPVALGLERDLAARIAFGREVNFPGLSKLLGGKNGFRTCERRFGKLEEFAAEISRDSNFGNCIALLCVASVELVALLGQDSGRSAERTTRREATASGRCGPRPGGGGGGEAIPRRCSIMAALIRPISGPPDQFLNLIFGSRGSPRNVHR